MLIGLLTNLTAVNSIYRGLQILQLQERGHELRVGMDGTQRRLEALRGCDVIHIYRAHDADVRRAVSEWRATGSGIVWDNDDDLTDMPGPAKTKRSGGALRSQEARADMMRMMTSAHVVTTPSEVLAAQYRSWGAEHVEVIENYLPEEYEIAPQPPHEGITIGWTAAAEHQHDLVELGIRDTLKDLLDAHPDLQVASIGIDLGIPSPRYRHRLLVQYPDLANHVAAFDIGIAPLADIRFNRARSNVKLKEYAAAGVPWLASPIGPYAGHGEREGGELVADGDWRAAIERLIVDVRRRRKLAKRGRKWVAAQTVAANLGRWESVLMLAAKRARSSG